MRSAGRWRKSPTPPDFWGPVTSPFSRGGWCCNGRKVSMETSRMEFGTVRGVEKEIRRIQGGLGVIFQLSNWRREERHWFQVKRLKKEEKNETETECRVPARFRGGRKKGSNSSQLCRPSESVCSPIDGQGRNGKSGKPFFGGAPSQPQISRGHSQSGLSVYGNEAMEKG
jgi:hypothetical protein